ncbi:MAG: hypothetical protein AUK35_07365 [Zetaproteobacteria bacterium CG2_30_46_52]|nr:MAG: hypothetical protein AUK35_07365 [Zetaproteobacteria bacterium CG2_30_46_52]
MTFRPLAYQPVDKKSPISAPFPYPEIQGNATSNSPSNTPAPQPILPLLGTAVRKQGGIEEERMRELEKMLNEAQSRTAVIEQEAYDKAYTAGERAGLALGEKRAEQALALLQTIVEYAEEELDHFKRESMNAVLDISEAIVEHTLGSCDEGMSGVLEKAVEQALQSFGLDQDAAMTLAVHPNDLALFERMTSMPAQYKIKANKDINQGTCRLITAGQDALVDPKETLKKAVSQLRESLLVVDD